MIGVFKMNLAAVYDYYGEEVGKELKCLLDYLDII